MINKIKNRIIDYIISRLYQLSDKATDQQKNVVLENWFIYSYKNAGVRYYCEQRIAAITKMLIKKPQDREQYLFDLGAIQEVKKLYTIVQREGEKAIKKQNKPE